MEKEYRGGFTVDLLQLVASLSFQAQEYCTTVCVKVLYSHGLFFGCLSGHMMDLVSLVNHSTPPHPSQTSLSVKKRVLRWKTWLFAGVGFVLIVLPTNRIDLASLNETLSSFETSSRVATKNNLSFTITTTTTTTTTTTIESVNNESSTPNNTKTEEAAVADTEPTIGMSSNSRAIKRYEHTPFRVYTCGYTTLFGQFAHDHATGLFPDAQNVSTLDHDALRNHTDQDLILNSVGGPCTVPWPKRWEMLSKLFNGTVIYVNGESVPMYPTNYRNGVFTVGPEADSSSTLRVYFGAMYLTTLMEDAWRPILHGVSGPHRPVGKGTHFLVYANSHCVKYRDDAFLRFAELGPVHRGGNCGGNNNNNGNISQAVGMRGKSWADNVQLFQSYRFALVMENTKGDGYITEKIINAFLAGSIPIWYGTTEVFQVFNHRAFIYYSPESPQAALDQVAYLERNRTAYQEMLQQPILADGIRTVEKYFSLRDDIGSGLLKKRIRRLIGFNT